MAIPTSSIQENQYFVTSTGQLRKVTKLDRDEQGRDRVSYLSKSVNIPGRKFDFAHPIANPPLLATFAIDCEKQLDQTEIADLIRKEVLLPGE